jgi:hypothetical protein
MLILANKLKRFPALTARQAEFIDLHLESKFVNAGQSMWEAGAGRIAKKFIREALTARIKIPLKAINVRGNIDAKFPPRPTPRFIDMDETLSTHSAPHIPPIT